MSLYISKVSEGLIQHVSVKKCKDEKKSQKETSVWIESYEGSIYLSSSIILNGIYYKMEN